MALVQHFPAAGVTEQFKDLASKWPIWDSTKHPPEAEENKFHFKYDGDHDTERVLVLSGKCTIKADDGITPTISINPGDAMYFHKGFACTWEILEPMQTHYGYFDREGNEIEEVELTCDVCGDDCFAESYLFNDEEDICMRCFRADAAGAEEFEGAVYQREGKPAKPPVPKQKSPPKKRTAEGVPAGSVPAQRPKTAEEIVAAAAAAAAATAPQVVPEVLPQVVPEEVPQAVPQMAAVPTVPVEVPKEA